VGDYEDDERRVREAALDETLAGTFPASDPPSSLPNPCDYSVLGRAAPAERTADRREPARRGSGCARPGSKAVTAGGLDRA
jgi:hypothetical protein